MNTIKNKSILIAEDEYLNYFFLEAVIKKMDLGLDIAHVDCGEKAIENAKMNHDMALILMDLKMPGIDGFNATEELRKFNKTIPIVAQTAYTSEEDKKKAMSSGCNAIITKPIDINLLEEIVRKYCS